MADPRISIEDSQLSRLVVERKLCTPNELELVKAEKKALGQKAAQTPLIELLIQHGYVTHSQVKRLNMSMDEDSLYRPAQQIPGFQILSKVGQGAMAVVFKAKQLSLDRTVAVKVLPKRLSENPEFVERFYREGRAAARLNHSNIVQAFDVGESGGYHYFVMEYIDGKTAYDLITDGKHVAEKDALKIILQCAKALQHAHDQNLIHRDVKPKNLMITLSGDVKLADMGLAREVGDYATATAEAGRAYGTPYYISPEQIRGEIDIDARADIYGLGATFYHLVTGKVPFDGTSPSAVMHKHLKEPLVPADHVNPALSSGVGEIIEVMMAKNREERYPSMAEVITDLEAVYNGEPPLQARQKYDHKLLQELATGRRVPEDSSEPKEAVSSSPRVSVQWLLVAGIVATISIIINIVLIAKH
ncbi:MAG: serine/threonine protein kinase [Planctomycetes bacterium]|nr:serine/threonine protein kinase [Planctomycetota bacterium]MBI3833591.1 serine/threonine protein kinase [Planctomycetota bacterium]